VVEARTEDVTPAAITVADDETLAEPHSLGRQLVKVLGVAAGARLVLFAFMALTAPAVPAATTQSSFVREMTRLFEGAPLLERLFLHWARWDGLWYVHISNNGYEWPNSEAFYPLYPMLMRAVAPLTGGNTAIAGVALSTCFFLAAVALVYYLVSLDFSPRVALWTTVFLSTFPTAFFFQAAYVDALLLLLVAACLLFSRLDRWALAGIVGFFATLTRSTGILLLVPMAVFYLQQRQWRPRGIDRRALWFLLPPAGIAVWLAYLWQATGDPFASFAAESHWGRHLTVPFVAVYRGLGETLWQFERVVLQGHWDYGWIHDYLAVFILIGWVALVWAGWRRLPPAYTAFCIALLVVSLCFPGSDRALFSLPRLMLTAFPLFIVTALLTEWHPRLRVALVAIFMIIACALSYEFVRHVFIA